MSLPSPPLLVKTPIIRAGGRAADALREITLTTGVNPYAEGSCLVKFGQTEVLCTASLQTGVPKWLRGKGGGWLTAEYGMLPRATHDRKDREAVKGKQESRTVEIQRLIGRSLRCVADLSRLGNYTLWLDCDVMVADGGTRTAAVTGAWVAAAIAVKTAIAQGIIKHPVFSQPVAAVSCGLTTSGVILDMDYQEDAQTLADANFVGCANGDWAEVQISAERSTISSSYLLEMQQLAQRGINQLIDLQQKVLDQTIA